MKFPRSALRSALSSTFRVVATLVALCLAAVVGWNLWVYYEQSPMTEDGRVRANVVDIAPDVTGRVVEVRVHDDQSVRKGDVLFRIDPVRYQLALNQAQAAVANQQAMLTQARHDADRLTELGNVATVQDAEQARTLVSQDQAALDQANANLQLAQVNLDRTTVVAPVNGMVTNFSLVNGAYLAAGSPALALVDSDSFYVAGYFEETKLPNIHVGDRASVHLMGESRALSGHVTGIAAAIGDPDLTNDPSLLANVNPTFTWVRLAQRVPVNITLDSVPKGVALVAGRTASVDIEPPGPKP